MENNENLAAPADENVEVPTEQSTENQPEMLTFTKEEFERIVGEKKAQAARKAERDMKRKYAPQDRLISLLKSGTGKEDLDDVYASLSDFYGKQGVTPAEKPAYSARETDILAAAEANDIIAGGYEDVVEELDRLAALGKDKMTAKEKAIFKTLAAHRQNEERSKELAELGVTDDVYNSKEFQELAAKFTSKTPIRDIYDIFVKMQPKKEVQTMGSVKNTGTADDGVKDFYTPEEARRFTKQDFDKNPKLFQAVLNSMPRWKK